MAAFRVIDGITLVPSTRYADFVAAARRVAPSVLLPVLANASIQQLTGGVYRPRPSELIHAWIIAAAARENSAYGNEYRHRTVTGKDLIRLRNTYLDVRDPFLNAAGQPGAVESLMVRTVFEQFPFEHSRFEDLSRLLLPSSGDLPRGSEWFRLDLARVSTQEAPDPRPQALTRSATSSSMDNMTFEEIPLLEWPLGGADQAQVRAAVDRWVRSEAMAELVRAFSGTPPHGHLEEALAQLTAFSETWDYRRGGLERSEVVPLDYPDKIDDLVRKAARALGLAGRNQPSTKRYNHVLILGGGPRTAFARCHFAAHLLRTEVEADSVTAISNLRPIGATEVEFATAEGIPDPRVEADVMSAALIRAFDVDGAPQRYSGVSPAGEPWRIDSYGPLTVLAVASNTPGRRANTQDGFIGWAAMVGGPPPTDRILAVTTDLYAPYQHAAAVLLLGMPYGCAVETVGLDVLTYGRWLDPSTTTAILQELRAAIIGYGSLVAAR